MIALLTCCVCHLKLVINTWSLGYCCYLDSLSNFVYCLNQTYRYAVWLLTSVVVLQLNCLSFPSQHLLCVDFVSRHSTNLYEVQLVKKLLFLVCWLMTKIFCRHLQRFWGASGDYWQSNWEYVYDLFGGNEMSLALWGMFLVYWINRFLFANDKFFQLSLC